MTEGKILYTDHDTIIDLEGNRIDRIQTKMTSELSKKYIEACQLLGIDPYKKSESLQNFIEEVHRILHNPSETPSESMNDLPECSMRYFHNGKFYCFRNAPNSKELIHGLKMCESCRHRVTPEELKELENLQKVKTEYFCSLGVTHAKKDPDLFVCKDYNCFYHGQWIRKENCLSLEEGGCSFLKKVIVEPKAPPRS